MTALGDAWISEMWRPCRELPYGDRVQKRKSDRAEQREMEERQAIHAVPTEVDNVVDTASTGCSEIGVLEQDKGAA